MSDKDRYTQIVGGRPLSDEEKARINVIKLKGQELLKLLKDEQEALQLEFQGTFAEPADLETRKRFYDTQPINWIEHAINDVQVGLMKAVRAISQPEF